ncbi:hypothetical protein C5167_048119 [Papaver somniferum]|uniref:RNase H type-1 domain-containing protein n=1 Tax=Papaver somniferum TaxID=3469 RepID=A0A4Y7KKM0_PAPSO|nr:uncharacterized protein LOC113301762 [Papaver somniferum]XP_026406355.1 uncharacterized protein LOC113301762 [Papaver somniferum]RZC72638.1 hypothetical protein C5167_048119 [Papaver somniferum]
MSNSSNDGGSNIHDDNPVSEQQARNTSADDSFLSGNPPTYDRRTEDEIEIHQEEPLEIKNHNEHDKFEEQSDDDNRYEDDDSEEDSSVLVEREGGSYSPIKSAKIQHEDLPLMKQGGSIPQTTTFKQNMVRLVGLFFQGIMSHSLSGGAGKSNIIFSSEHKIDPDDLYWINTDGYFRKGEPIAGYGAIVRDGSGNPIVAYSGINPKPFSLIYHQLEGIMAGLELAKEKGIRKIEMCCNSERTREVILRFYEDRGLDCPHRHSSYGFSDGKDIICRACVEVFFLHSTLEQSRLFPLLNNVIALISSLEYTFHINAVERRLNLAADYLAKQAKDGKYEAHMFPYKLRGILEDDAWGRPLNGIPFSSQGFYARK